MNVTTKTNSKLTPTGLAIICTLISGIALAEPPPRPAPDVADFKYGPHERNVFDFWKPKGEGPFPLVLFIHGGGFMGGDKKELNPNGILRMGWAAAAINYRYTTTPAPAPAQYLDCARALQTLRAHAKEWNIDPTLAASTGGSAGGGISLWLAFHDDLADPKSEDPVARQSTRLTTCALGVTQTSYDPRFAEKIGIIRPNFERHNFFLPFYGIKRDEIDTPKAYALYEAAAPITYLTKDDPAVFLFYNRPNAPVTDETDTETKVHHPKLGLALKERMDALGIECIVQCDFKGGHQYYGSGPDERIQPYDFIKKQFEKARAAK